MKDELGGKIMAEFAALRPKSSGYLTDDNKENKKPKTRTRTKKCVIKRKHQFDDYKHCLGAVQLENKINQLEKNKVDEEIIKNL